MTFSRHQILKALAGILIGVALFFSVVRGIEYLIPRFVDLQEIKQGVEEAVSTQVFAEDGWEMIIEDVRVKLTWTGPKAIFSNGLLTTPDREEAVRINEIAATVRWWPLIIGRTPELDTLEIDSVKARLAENPQIEIVQTDEPKRIVTRDTRIILRNFTVEAGDWVDELNVFYAEGETIEIRHLDSDRPLDIIFQGTVSAWDPSEPDNRQEISDLYLRTEVAQSVISAEEEVPITPSSISRLSIDVEELDLGELSWIIRRYGIDLMATGVIDNFEFDYRRPWTEIDDPDLQERFRLLTESTNELQVNFGGYHFDLDPGYIRLDTQLLGRRVLRGIDIVVDSDPYRVAVDGQASLGSRLELDDILLGEPIDAEALQKGARVDLNVETTMLPMEFLDFIPDTSPLGRLFAQASGGVRLNAEIEGSLQEPDLQGQLEFEDLAFTHMRWDAAQQDLVTGGITDVYGKVRFRGQRVILNNVRGELNGTPFRLNVAYNRARKILANGRFVSEQLDINALKLTLLHFADILEISVPEPLKQLAYAGAARADLRFQGPLDNPAINGTLALNDVALYALEEAQRLLVRNINGRIRFNGRTVVIPGLAFKIDNQTMRLSGRYFINREAMDLQIAGADLQAGPLLENLTRLARTLELGVSPELVRQLDRLLINGVVNVALRVNGPVDNPAINGSVRLQRVDVASRQAGEALLENLRGVVHFNEQTATFRNMAFLLNRQPLSLTGNYRIDTQRLNARITGDNLQADPAIEGLLALADTFDVEISAQLREQLDRFEIAGGADADIAVQGPPDNLEITGVVNLEEIAVTDQQQNLTISNITGRLLLEPTRLVLENVRAFLGSSRFLVEGTLDEGPDGAYRDYRFNLTGEDVNLQQFREEVLAKLVSMEELTAQISDLSGIADINLTATGVLEPEAQPKLTGEIAVQNLSVFLEALGTQAQLENILLSFTEGGRLVLPRTRGRAGPIEFVIEGGATDLLTGEPVFEFTLDTAALPVASLMENPEFFQNLIGFPYPIPTKASGMIDFRGYLSQEEVLGTLIFENAMLAWDDGTEVRELDGQVRITLEEGQVRLASQTLDFKTGDYLVENDFAIALEETDNLDDPFNALVWLDSKLFNLENLTENPLYRVCANALMRNRTLALKESYLNLLDGGEIELAGLVRNPLSFDRLAYELHLLTPEPLDLSAFSRNLPDPSQVAGTAALNLVIAGDMQPELPVEDGEPVEEATSFEVVEPLVTVTGEVSLDQVKLALLRVQELTGDFDLNGSYGSFDIDRFNIPGVDLALSGDIQTFSEFPLPLDNVRISGDLFAVPAWNLYIQEVGQDIIVENFVLPVFGPPAEDAPAVPVTFRDTELDIDEVIYQNIIISDVTGLMDLLPTGYLHLREVAATVAEGDIDADISVFPKNNGYISARIQTEGVKANALAVALLNAPNQIFGDLDGTILFTTQGQTEQEAIENANGTVSFSVTNGRLPAIAKVETLLVAANIIRGGVLGLNLNNIVRALQPFDTNYFAELSGNLQLRDGVAYTDDILSDGENLDLLIQGSMRLTDGYADMVVNGTMSQNVTGALGELGKLSVSSILRFVPGVGYIPGTDNGGLLSYIPGVGYVPGFGGRVDDTSHFQVVIEGFLDDPEAIAGFDWVPGGTVTNPPQPVPVGQQ